MQQEEIIACTTETANNNGWRPSEHVQIIGNWMTQEQTRVLKELIDKFSDVFSIGDEDIGQATFSHEIKIDGVTPINSRSYPFPYAKREAVKDQIDKMLRMGVIEPSSGEFSSPVVLVKKSDGKERFCVDFRNLNAATIKDNYPMPWIQERLDQLSGCKYFSVLDLTAGYWQFKMDPNSKKWTAFKTHVGGFEFVRMPFGLCNAGATFQPAMEKMLKGLPNASAYIDDLLIFSKTFEEHLDHLGKVLSRLREAKLKVKTNKCQLAREKTKFFFDIAEPLTQLTRKHARFSWCERAEQAFKTLAETLVNPPVLAYPDFSNSFRLITDASAVGIGAVLCQEDENGNERPLCYSSRTLNKAERNYSTIKRELLAIVWATKQYRQYIYGTTFEVVTDHKPLTYMKSMRDASPRLNKWCSKLEEYAFKINIKLNSNGGADIERKDG